MPLRVCVAFLGTFAPLRETRIRELTICLRAAVPAVANGNPSLLPILLSSSAPLRLCVNTATPTTGTTLRIRVQTCGLIQYQRPNKPIELL